MVFAWGVAEQQRRNQQRRRRGGRQERRSSGGLMSMFTFFPLLAIPVVFYNVIVGVGSIFGAGEGGEGAAAAGAGLNRFADERFTVHMPTGGEWIVTSGDILLTVALVLLFVELLKSTSTGRSAIANHALSLVLFIVCLIEFLLWPPFATSVFFLITVMTLLDVLAGFIVTIVTARRDIAVGQDFN